jgi:general secretion pathway protein G
MDNKQDKGFTLVELLIVIVILGILATVTVFAVRGITDQGEESACRADQKTLQVAIEAYLAQEGGTTVVEGDLTPDYMASESKNFTIDADLVAVPDTAVRDNPCTAFTDY